MAVPFSLCQLAPGLSRPHLPLPTKPFSKKSRFPSTRQQQGFRPAGECSTGCSRKQPFSQRICAERPGCSKSR